MIDSTGGQNTVDTNARRRNFPGDNEAAATGPDGRSWVGVARYDGCGRTAVGTELGL
jgi:hypothetical protein